MPEAPASRAHREELRGSAPSAITGSSELRRLLPGEVRLSAEDEEELVRFLRSTLTLAAGERSDFVKRLVEFQESYRTPRPVGEKTFPFKKASQVTVPIVKMIVNVVAPRIVAELLRPSPLWTLRSTADAQIFERVAKPVEEFLDLYAQRRMNIERKVEDLILEGCKLGGAVWEVTRDVERKQMVRYSVDGESIELVEEPFRSGPQIFNVPLEDFWWKFGFTDLQQMPWCGKLLHITSREIRDRVKSGLFRREGAEKIIARGGQHGWGIVTDSRQVAQKQEEFERTEPGSGTLDLYDIFELYVYWPIRVGGREVTADLRVFYSLDSNVLLRVQLNPWWHGLRPFLVWPYSPVEHRLIGEGIAELVEQLQEEVTSIHRLRLDNATLANMRMIITSRLVEGLKPGDPLYPGKVIRASSADDVKPFQLTDIYPSTIQNEALTMNLIERVSGVNEAMLGRAMPVTRTTATAQTSLLEENRQRFELTIRRARALVGRAGEMTYDLFHQFGTAGLAEEWLGDRGMLVEELFKMPRERVTQGFAVRVLATTARVNRQIEMQSNLQLFQLLVQLHQQLMPLVVQFAPQHMPLVAQALISSSKKFMLRVLEAFDEKDPEGILAALTLLERILPSPESAGVATDIRTQLEELNRSLSGLGPELGREVGANISTQFNGMESALRALAGAANGGERVGGGLFDAERFTLP